MSEMNLKSIMQNNSIVGVGGAGFPSYAKLADGAEILVINCAECEPLMYTDYMIMREEMSKIAEGAKLVMAETSSGDDVQCALTMERTAKARIIVIILLLSLGNILCIDVSFTF